MKHLDLYWRSKREWWHFDKDHHIVLNDDAPKEAKESYERYLKQSENDRAL